MKVINTGLIYNPLNWAIVLLMLIIAAAGGAFLASLLNLTPATPEN